MNLLEKLSKTQLQLIKLMQNGWELGRSEGFNSRWWLQKGGCGKGGEAKTINMASAYKLWKLGIIKENKRDFPITTFKLTEVINT